MIGTNCIGSYKSNYHSIATTTTLKAKKDRRYHGQKKKDRRYHGQKKKDRRYHGQKKKDKEQTMIYKTLHYLITMHQNLLAKNK